MSRRPGTRLLHYVRRQATKARCGRQGCFPRRTAAGARRSKSGARNFIELSLKFLSSLLTAAQQAGGEETVEAGKPRLGRPKMQWQGPQFAVFIQDFGQTANLVRCDRNTDDAWRAAKESRNLHFVFLGLHR